MSGTQKALLRLARTRPCLFSAQVRRGAARRRPGGHAKDGQSYQRIMLSGACACDRRPAAALAATWARSNPRVFEPPSPSPRL